MVLVISHRDVFKDPTPIRHDGSPSIFPPKKVTNPTCEKMDFPQFQNLDIATPKCGLKLNLVSFTVDTLPSFNAVVIPCMLYEAVTPTCYLTQTRMEKHHIGKTLLTLLLSSLPTYFMFSVTVVDGANSSMQWTDGRETQWTAVLELSQYSPIQSNCTCPPMNCLILLPNSGQWVKPGLKQHICPNIASI